MSVDAPGTFCAECGYKFDAMADADGNDAVPEDGDITICFKCGAVLLIEAVHGVVVSLNRPSEEKLADIYEHNPDLKVLQQSRRMVLRSILMKEGPRRD